MNGAQLRAWRKRLGIKSRAAAARVLGCGPRAIAYYEDGERTIPRYIALACAAVAMNIPPYGERAPDDEARP